MYLNKAIIIGNITKDPELKALPSGINVASFGVATNRTWKDKTGVKQEKPEFHNVVVFGKQAESVHTYMKKGSQILVEGRIETRSWDGQDGKKNYRTEIIAETMQFGPKRSTESKPIEKPDERDSGDGNPHLELEEDINLEDIPF